MGHRARYAWALLFLSGLLLHTGGQAPKPKKLPNVLLLTVDTLRAAKHMIADE